MEVEVLFLKKITPIAKLLERQYTYQNIAGEGYVAWNPRNASLTRRKLLSERPWEMMILEGALLLCFLGFGDDFSRTSKRRFFPGEVLTFFFLVGSGTNTPGAKSESESTSVVYATAIR